MTRVAVLADIHGNLPALEAVEQDLAAFAVDHVVVAGDLINPAPFSVAVLQRVQNAGWSVLRGNHEFYLLDYNTMRAPTSWSDRNNFALIPYTYDLVPGMSRKAIAAWPDTLSLRFADAPPLRFFHGSPRSNREGIYPQTTEEEIETIFAGIEEETIVLAHTHLVMERRIGNRFLLNPGSVGLPFDGVPGARYLLLEGDETGWKPTFRHVLYDNAALFAEWERTGFLEQSGIIGLLAQKEFRTARPQLYPFNRWRKVHFPEAPLSYELLQAFYQIDSMLYRSLPYQTNASI